MLWGLLQPEWCELLGVCAFRIVGCVTPSSGSADVVGAALCGGGWVPARPGWEKCGINVGGIKVFVKQCPAAAGRQILAGGGRSYKTLAVGMGPASSTCKESETEP